MINMDIVLKVLDMIRVVKSKISCQMVNEVKMLLVWSWQKFY